MYNSIKLNLYTQDDCPYCFVMKQKLTEWGYDFIEINISYNLDKKKFLKEEGHRTVPQVYWNKIHLNKVNTEDFTKEVLEAEIDYEKYQGGVENFA